MQKRRVTVEQTCNCPPEITIKAEYNHGILIGEKVLCWNCERPYVVVKDELESPAIMFRSNYHTR